MLTDAGSTPATSTTCNTGLDLSRPDISYKDQPLEHEQITSATVSSGLNSPQKRHENDTRAAQDALDQLGTRECKPFRNAILGEFSLFKAFLVKEYIRVANDESYVEANQRLLKRVKGTLNPALWSYVFIRAKAC